MSRGREGPAVFAGLAAGLLGACSSGDSALIASGPEPPASTEESAPASVTSDTARSVAQSSLGDDPMEWVPWQPSDAWASRCVGNAEFVPLAVVPRYFRTQWRSVDPGSRYLYWADELSNGDGLHTRLFRWSLEQGITLVGEYVDAYLLLPSADGKTVVGSRSVEGTLTDAFRWSQVGGAKPLDFIPFGLDASGDVIVGAGAQGLVRWSEHTGAQVVDVGANVSMLGGLGMTKALDIIAGSDLDGRAFRWTEAGGSVDLGALDGPRSRVVVRDVSASGDVIFGLAYDELDVIRPFRWTLADGIRELDAPADTPDDASVVPEYMSADGRVIVGQVRLADVVTPGSPAPSYPFRWTKATGTQELLPRERTAYATHLSQGGDVVLGTFWDSVDRGFRWTMATGFQEIDSPAWPGIAADGDLLVGTNAQGPFVRTFGELQGTQPEIVSLASPALVPDGWSLPRLDGISDDGRMLFGEALNPDGQQQAWLLHPSERCTNP